MKKIKMFKFLAVLLPIMATSTSYNSVFAIINTTKQEEKTLKNVKQTKQEKEEQLEEIHKINCENLKKNLKLQEKDEQKLLEESIKIFKNFKKEDYEVPDFKLIVYFYCKVPILYYEDIKTGAKIVFTPLDSVLKLTDNPEHFKHNMLDEFTFNAFTLDDKGLVHYLEHCIASDFGINLKKNEKYSSISFDAKTKEDRLALCHSSFNNNIDKKFYKTFFKALRKPKMLENNKTFEIEKRRIIVEMLNAEKEDELNDVKYHNSNSEYFYNYGGATKELEKIKNEDVKKYFKEIIHPSNLLVTRYVELNKEKIKNYLNLFKKEYLQYFNYKEINIPEYKMKKNVEFLKFKTNDDLKYLSYYDEFSNVVKNKYSANICFYNEFVDGRDFLPYKIFSTRICFDESFSKKYIKKIQQFIEKFGYSKIIINSLGCGFNLFGDNKKAFEKEKLKENSKKILDYELKLFEELKKEELEENCFSFEPFNYNKAPNHKNNTKFGFTNPYNLLRSAYSRYHELLQDNFIMYKDPFSQKQVLTKLKNNNELIASKEDLLNQIEKEKPLLIKELKNAKPKSILVYEKIAKKQKDKKYYEKLFNFKKPYFIPLKFTNTKNNDVLEAVAKQFINEKLDYITKENAINYYNPGEAHFLGKYVSLNVSPEEKITKQELKFYYEEFFEIFKNLKITEKEFEIFKKDCKKNINYSYKNSEKNKKFLDDISKEIENYLKNDVKKETESSEKNKTFKITKETKRDDLFKKITKLPELSKSFKDYLNLRNSIAEFALKHNQVEYSSSTHHIPIQDEELLPINKNYVKDLNEYVVKPKFKAFNNFYDLTKKALKEIEKISYKDFMEIFKSLSLVEKEEYEKDRKEQDKIRKKLIER